MPFWPGLLLSGNDNSDWKSPQQEVVSLRPTSAFRLSVVGGDLILSGCLVMSHHIYCNCCTTNFEDVLCAMPNWSCLIMQSKSRVSFKMWPPSESPWASRPQSPVWSSPGASGQTTPRSASWTPTVRREQGSSELTDSNDNKFSESW